MEEKKPAKLSVFETLAAINCNEHIEKKSNGKTELSYLSWAWAWHYVKMHYPAAFYTIYETPEGRPYFDDGRTGWVKTGVTIEGQEHIEYLPIMDYRNASIPIDKITSMDMNKTIQRSLTKAAARHGLGLYIYAGEDLPFSAEEAAAQEAAQAAEKPVKATKSRKDKETPAQPEKVAGNAPEIAPYTPLPQSQYWAVVRLYATGQPTKAGGNYRDEWITITHADADAIAAFDADVQNFRNNNTAQ